MNKGLECATGDYIYFLNAGDYLCNDNVLKNVIEGFSVNSESDMIYGDYIYYDDNGEQRCSGYRDGIPDFLRRGYCHQTLFAKKSIFIKCGNFNTDYKIYADFDWLLRALIGFRKKISYIDIPIANYLKGGESESHGSKYNYERTEIIQKNAGYQELLLFFISYPFSFSIYMLRLFREKIKILISE